jgi:hypothetical protein
VSEATGVSFFFSNESVVDTPRLFGVKSASSLVVVGFPRVVTLRLHLSRLSVFFLKIEFALFYLRSGALSPIERMCRAVAT